MGGVIAFSKVFEEFEIFAAKIPLSIIFKDVFVDDVQFLLPSFI
jgi:hypothetical protein